MATSTVRPLLTENEVSEQIKVPALTLTAWRHRGKGPIYMKVGKHVRYRQDDLDAWLNEQAVKVGA